MLVGLRPREAAPGALVRHCSWTSSGRSRVEARVARVDAEGETLLVGRDGSSAYAFLGDCVAVDDDEADDGGHLLVRGGTDLSVCGAFDGRCGLWRRRWASRAGLCLDVLEDVPPDDGCDGERTLWPAAFAAAAFLDRGCGAAARQRPGACCFCLEGLRDKTVLELGAGAGLPTLVAALCCGAARATATEQPRAVDFIEANVDANRALLAAARRTRARSAVVEARPLWWGDGAALGACLASAPDLVLACDCTYKAELHAVLLRTIAAALGGPEARRRAEALIFSDKESTPSAEAALRLFVRRARESGLRAEEIDPPGGAHIEGAAPRHTSDAGWRAFTPKTVVLIRLTVAIDSVT